MNAEQQKELARIKTKLRIQKPDGYIYGDIKKEDADWLITRLEAEARELYGIDLLLERRDALSDCKTRYDKIAKAFRFAAKADVAETRCAAFEGQVQELKDEAERARFDVDTTREAHITTHKRATILEGQVRELREALEKVDAKQRQALEKLREVGYVYNNTDDLMKRLVFALYTYLVELSQNARAALAAAAPGEPECRCWYDRNGFFHPCPQHEDRTEPPAKEEE